MTQSVDLDNLPPLTGEGEELVSSSEIENIVADASEEFVAQEVEIPPVAPPPPAATPAPAAAPKKRSRPPKNVAVNPAPAPAASPPPVAAATTAADPPVAVPKKRGRPAAKKPATAVPVTGNGECQSEDNSLACAINAAVLKAINKHTTKNDKVANVMRKMGQNLIELADKM